MIKFMYNGIKIEGKLHKAHYSKGSYIPEANIAEGTITIYSRGYEPMPNVPGLITHNNTDTMTDYFDKDKLRVDPKNPYYEAVKAAYEKQQEKIKARANKRKQI